MVVTFCRNLSYNIPNQQLNDILIRDLYIGIYMGLYSKSYGLSTLERAKFVFL